MASTRGCGYVLVTRSRETERDRKKEKPVCTAVFIVKRQDLGRTDEIGAF